MALNGASLPQQANRTDFDAAGSGWINAGRNLVLAKSPTMPVATAKSFTFSLQPVTSTTSVNFVCDNGVTAPGDSVYVVGSIDKLGNWDPAKAVKLDPNIYWEYIYNPPPGPSGPGPSAPVWTGVIADLPPNPSFEWKCIRRAEDAAGAPLWQPGANNVFSASVKSGYAGRTYGKF